jgi:hypothetical protein
MISPSNTRRHRGSLPPTPHGSQPLELRNEPRARDCLDRQEPHQVEVGGTKTAQRELAILGDSHAAALEPALRSVVARHGIFVPSMLIGHMSFALSLLP